MGILFWSALGHSKAEPPSGGERRVMGSRRNDAMAIVGALDHQEALRCLLDRGGRSVVAALVPEPTHPQDPDAVAVVIDQTRVGYLAAGVARKYGPILSSQAAPMLCPAQLHGGEWDMPIIRVILDFSPVYAASRSTDTT
jgi:hypothetical protein